MTGVAAVALLAASFSSSAFAHGALHCARHDNVVSPSHVRSQSLLESVRLACPLLGRIIEEYALRDLGEIASNESETPPTREIAMVAAFAALGDAASIKHHAKHAREVGATTREFEELLYLIAVHVGVPKAIAATRALSDLLVDRSQEFSPDRSTDVALRHF